MTVIVSDSFNRADNATSLGVTDTGQTWQCSNTDVWGIINNQAYQPTVYARDDISFVDIGVSDNIKISSDIPVAYTNGIVFRYADTGNYFRLLLMGGGTVYLQRFLTGGKTNLASKNVTIQAPSTISVEVTGSTIKAYYNNTLLFTVTDSNLTTTTKYGIVNYNSNLSMFDNFIVEDIGSTSTGTPVTYTYDTKQSIYANIQSNYDTKQSIYSNQSTNFDTKQSIYKSITQPYDTKQAIYKAIQELFDTEQVFTQAYTQVSYTYDMKIQQYKDIQESLDTKQAYYTDISVDLDTKQVIYKQIQNLYDTLIQIRNKHDETLYGALTIQRVIEHRLTINKRHSEDLKIERVLNHILRV